VTSLKSFEQKKELQHFLPTFEFALGLFFANVDANLFDQLLVKFSNFIFAMTYPNAVHESNDSL